MGPTGIDGKEVDIQENGRVQKAVTVVAIGVLTDGVLSVLACHTALRPGEPGHVEAGDAVVAGAGLAPQLISCRTIFRAWRM